MGHDLTIRVERWSGEIELADDASNTSVEVTMQLGTLRVVSGSGGMKPLSDSEKREIAGTARKILGTDRHPEARFVSTSISASDSGGVVHGELTLRGQSHPLDLAVTDLGQARYRGSATIVQSQLGIKPYTAFLGALKLADEVGVTVTVDLTGDT